MTVTEVMTTLRSLGSESTKKLLVKHGAVEPFYGVKVADLKVILKKIKHDQALAMELYDTGNSDAMYLAGLIANGASMTRKQLQTWVGKAPWQMISEYTVPWVASENPGAMELGLEWIDSDKEKVAASGWNTISCTISMRPDTELDLDLLRTLLKRVENNIHKAPNRVKYTMNGFVIAVGCYVKALTEEATAAGKRIGNIEVDMGNTACILPSSVAYIKKVKDKGNIGKKKKTAKC